MRRYKLKGGRLIRRNKHSLSAGKLKNMITSVNEEQPSLANNTNLNKLKYSLKQLNLGGHKTKPEYISF